MELVKQASFSLPRGVGGVAITLHEYLASKSLVCEIKDTDAIFLKWLMESLQHIGHASALLPPLSLTISQCSDQGARPPETTVGLHHGLSPPSLPSRPSPSPPPQSFVIH